MPNIKSAKKRMRQTVTRTLENKMKKSMMRTYLRKLREAVEAKDKASAEALLPTVYRKIDKAAKGGCIHQNTAARRKALAARLVATLG